MTAGPCGHMMCTRRECTDCYPACAECGLADPSHKLNCTRAHRYPTTTTTTTALTEELLVDGCGNPDPVNRPQHYTRGGVECIDAIEAALGADGFRAFCRGQVLKYTWRCEHKGNRGQDLAKANYYMRKLTDGH